MKLKTTVLFPVLMLASGAMQGQSLPVVKPSKAGMDVRRLSYADEAIMQSIRNGEIPGAVLAVVRRNKIAYLKAYGNKQVYPDTVPMSVHTVFDLASVSKSVSTAISAMILLERGKLRLSDPVAMYIPGFRPWTDTTGRARSIRIIELMTHTSGLPPYASVEELGQMYDLPNPQGLLGHICDVQRNSEPGTVFDYSCLNFITLQHIIQNISGMSLQEFARRHIFMPLKMTHTDYNPSGETLAWAAPTKRQADGTVLTGRVHDPLANVANGGVSGNAGVFSNAEDLATLAAMLLNGGEINGVRILAPLTVQAMRTVPKGFEKFGRSPGWDVFSAYAKDGDLFDVSAYGHTGYTGTSITIDPETGTAVILLTNRVHPDDKGGVTRLRDIVANVVAAAVVKN
ncbi:MAG: beta-lactamase family protein [Bacteroidales bacterium]|nr:beta-lactamase family protein [Bacteroidales bacterium]